ncbi:MAG: cytochrome c oxidase subunit II [Acidimicrobiales bacterium]|nr:cytochrome c oxidase subunit II [Acidimicrobiales bacterium]
MIPSVLSRISASKVSKILRAPKVLVLIISGVLIGGCNLPTFGGYRGSTTQAQSTFKLFSLSVIASLVVGAIVWLLMFWAFFRYRRKRGDETMPKQFHQHHLIEIIYTVIPSIIVAFLFYFTYVTENTVDAVSTHPFLDVKITAFQWGWEFQYSADDGSGYKTTVIGNDISGSYTPPVIPVAVLPVDETIRVTLVSKDVVHGFYVPSFNFSRYAQPGQVNQFDFNITSAGYYPGRCTQFCGLYHTEMLFGFKAVSTSQFDQWIAQHNGKTISSGS